MGLSTKVIGRQTSNQTELFETILGNWNYLTITSEMFINIFFFQLILWEMSINFYIGFHKKKIKKFIGLNGQIFGTILGNFSIFINLIYLFIL